MRRRKRGGERRIRGEVDERMRGGEEEEKERRIGLVWWSGLGNKHKRC